MVLGYDVSEKSYASKLQVYREDNDFISFVVRLIYRVIRNDCRGFNNLSYAIHLR